MRDDHGIEVEALADGDLEAVAGGLDGDSTGGTCCTVSGPCVTTAGPCTTTGGTCTSSGACQMQV